MAKQDDYSRYTIRVPQELYAALEADAAAANRSVNAEIVDRLAFSNKHTEEQWNELFDAVEHLDKRLDEAHARNQELSRHAGILKEVNDRDFDFQRRLMYHVLNFVDDIPVDLAVWASDIIASIERTEFMAQLHQSPGSSEVDIRKTIKDRRDNYVKEALAAIRKHMDDQP